MKANELRSNYVKFFESKDHRHLASASLIPHDTSLLFVNSGMVPFKPYFLGEEKPEFPRAVTVQKCVRAGGKHNDLEEVGRTSRHFTFFEMLGNFSFGDYFKDTAIPMAWEFFTEVLKLDSERLWVTIHETDDEAESLWREKVGIPASRIQRLDEDNWWRMADTGPNGPCSEIFWDKGEAYGKDGGPAHGGEDRFIEIWNLVFMQFATDANGVSTPLPKPSIDTGAGLERLLSVLQNKDSVFEIDEMARLIQAAQKATGYTLGKNKNADLALRVLADHSRAMTFLISDGVFPSNEDRGYVLRRIMRRAIRFAYLLGVEKTITPDLVNAVIDIMADDYPQLREGYDHIATVVEREEIQFRKTLATGSNILEQKLDELPGKQKLPGGVAFMLHDTYGFPFEVTAEVVAEKGIEVDREGFDAAMKSQRAQSKKNRKESVQADDFEEIQTLLESHGVTTFVGREQTRDVKASVLLVTPSSTPGTVSLFVDQTPFYAESGGQVGDTGIVTFSNGSGRILDTVYAAPGIHRHVFSVESGDLQVGDTATLSIDEARRAKIAKNHTATHLLHWALRKVLGDQVKQQGSLVSPDRLRFDFSHFEPVSPSDLKKIEDLVTDVTLGNTIVQHSEVTKKEAEDMGALAFFGDKYGDTVRVLEAGDSLEFCGGTHVSATGDIGLVKIVSESSIGSNLRRIEAVTGEKVLELLRSKQETLEKTSALLQVPVNTVLDGVRKKLDDLQASTQQVKKLKSSLAASKAAEFVSQAEDGIVIKQVDGLSRDDLQTLAHSLKAFDEIHTVVLGGAPEGGGAALVAVVDEGSATTAGELISDAAKLIKGGGGKGKTFAMAGGKDPAGIGEALKLAQQAAKN